MDEEFNEILQEVGEQLEEDEDETQERISNTISNISNIIRFLDAKIITNLSYEYNSRGNLQIVAEYYDDPGILIYEKMQEFQETDEFLRDNAEFHTKDNIPTDNVIQRYGREVYLTRDDELVEFTRNETNSPGHPEKQKIRLSNPRELEISELLEEYPDFETTFYGCFKKVVINAIEKNPKKRGIFQKIIDYINRIEEQTRE